MIKTSGYTLIVTCDTKGYCPDVRWWSSTKNEAAFFGETFGECKLAAHREGWTFHRNGKHSCPMCSGKLEKRRKNLGEQIMEGAI